MTPIRHDETVTTTATTTTTGRRRWPLAAVVALVVVAALGCSSPPPDEATTTTTTTTTPPTTTTTEPPLDAGTVVSSYTPGAGDCFDRRRLEPEQGGNRVVLLLDCDTPHTFEVIGVFTVDEATVATTADLTAYPGLDALTNEARRQCPPLFADWVGTPYELSELELSWVLPEAASWAAGSRIIGCTVWDPTAERMAGSTRNSQR